MTEALATTEHLYTPGRLEDLKQEHDRLDRMVGPHAPDYVRRGVGNVQLAREQLASLKKRLEDGTPRPYASDELDDAIKLEEQLADQIRDGMPTRDEMMKNPVGAADKHMMWERRKKAAILKWKHIRRRRFASGDIDAVDEAKDVANVEILRPLSKAQELPMHNPQIERQKYYGGQESVTLNEDELAVIKELEPDLLETLALMDPGQRRQVKALVARVLERSEKPYEEWEWLELVDHARVLGVQTDKLKREDVIARIREHEAAQQSAA